MNKTSFTLGFNQLLVFLRAALWGNPLPTEFVENTIDWPSVIRHAERQTLSALVADVILQHSDVLNVPAGVQSWAQQSVAMARQGNIRLNLAVRAVVSYFQQHHVPVVLLKGQGNAQNYPKPALRQCGDIDLYVGPEYYAESARLMCKLSGESEFTMENAKHYVHQYRGVEVELHRKTLSMSIPGQAGRFQQWTEESMQPGHTPTVPFGDVNVALPAADYNVVYVFAHAWNHFLLGGVGLRQLCDWALLLHTHASALDANQLKRRLQGLGLWTPWRICACVAVEQLGLPAEECPGYDTAFRRRAARALQHIMNEGNFGHHDEHRSVRPEGYFAGKWSNCCNMVARMWRLSTIAPMSTIRTLFNFVISGLESIVVVDRMGFRPKSVNTEVTKSAAVAMLALLLLCGCGSPKRKPLDLPTTRNYYCPYFEVNYPATWDYDEEFNDMAADEGPIFGLGVRVSLYPRNHKASRQCVTIQKSAMPFFLTTPEGWRDFSVELKQFDEHYLMCATQKTH